jgi:deazaflavin-dependent oxidoreductase (nitroreductase family)
MKSGLSGASTAKLRQAASPKESWMPAHNDALKRQLAQTREIELTVTGRKSGRAISIPVWFVLDGETLYLVPICGSDTQWYKNVLSRPSFRIRAAGTQGDLQATTIADRGRVSSIVNQFRSKYGADDVQKYYSKLDVAVAAELP